MKVKKFIPLFTALVVSPLFPKRAEGGVAAYPLRAGIALGTVNDGGVSLSLDAGPVFNNNVTVGAEIFGTHLVAARGLIWERPSSFSGFYGGGKIYLGLGSAIRLEPAAEAGWLYRFANKVDAGGGLDLVIGRTIGGVFKLTFGYIF